MAASSIRAAWAPYAGMSRRRAVSEGCTRRHSVESSQATMERSAGTASPISWATPRPAMAKTSLSNTIAVGRRAALSSRRVARALLTGVVGRHRHRLGQVADRPSRMRRYGCAGVQELGQPTDRAMRRCPSAYRYSTVSTSGAASSDQTLGRRPLSGPADDDRRKAQLLQYRDPHVAVAQVAAHQHAVDPPLAPPSAVQGDLGFRVGNELRGRA